MTKKIKNKASGPLALVICAVYLLTACGGPKQTDATEAGTAKDTVAAFIVQQDTLHKTVELPAELLPYEYADLYAKVEGFVQEMKVDLGDKVRKGQVLAVIKAPEVNSRFAESEASVSSAKAKWTSSKDNYERLYRASQARTPGIVAPVDLERSRNQMMADSSAYVAAEKQSQAYRDVSGYLHITAPFNGIITARKVNAGAFTGTNTPLLTIQDLHLLRLRAAVPEIYTGAARAAGSIDFRVDAYPLERFAAKLTRKSGAIDPATRTELWEFEVPNSEGKLKAGAFAYVKIALQRDMPSVIVPATAITTTQERKFVIRVRQDKAEWVDIRQGLTTDKGTEIFAGIQPGDTLLMKATDERKPGSTAFWKVNK
ncbi:efflux RND transporter periplasmic adaptor subunit [Chitinophaga sp. CF418]|uniref:efflux RND transporter periplasmic adaptor subunit n=1 Tax=Chitinophaga sp. CF418 TaxID=1855287 RepID=UPI00091B1BDE|nr:efflux RND transporter periplasmic adaptor subunit [Chitinophaga sp. CF418]SHM15569.1 RND family efflux transporter, MFP subunit [Chitinophaga sp. CF418]